MPSEGSTQWSSPKHLGCRRRWGYLLPRGPERGSYRNSLAWFKGKSAGYHGFYMVKKCKKKPSNLGEFPAIFPWNQSNDLSFDPSQKRTIENTTTGPPGPGNCKAAVRRLLSNWVQAVQSGCGLAKKQKIKRQLGPVNMSTLTLMSDLFPWAGASMQLGDQRHPNPSGTNPEDS